MGERRGTKALELWCKRVTQGYDGVSIENMSTSWKDGLAFCALIHHFRPELIDYENLDKNDVYGNNELAFRVAENHLGIPALLDPEDMVCVEIPDRLSILTYLSQFYQTFSSQATTPVKTSPESPTAVERPRTNTGSGQNPPTKLGAGVGGCRVCNQSVFLAQRLLISGHLFHRTCFKCARCGALLSVANYYETQDSKYCCETCPDEERMVVQQSSQSVDDDDDEDDGGGATVTKRLHRRGSSSLVGDRRALFETLAAADCTDDVKASKKAQRPVTLKMADPPIVEEKTAVISDDNDSGVIVVSDKKESSGGDTKTSSVSVSCSRETLSDVLVADEPCKEGDTALAASEDKTIVVPSTGAVESLVTATDELSLPSPPPPPPPPLLPSFPHGVLPVANGLPESQTSFSHVMLLPDDLKPPTPDKELDVHVVKPPLKDVPILSSSLSDDLKQVLESPPSFATMADNGIEEQVLAESPEDLEIKTLANKLLKMDYYESNNKDVPVPSPRKKIKSPIKIINYPENLNPFDDVEENDNENKINSTNPFGSDSEDEDREHDVIEIKTNVSLNPFSSDEDENEIRCQPPPPLPKPRMILSPVLKLRYQTHRKQSSTSSISSYATTPRKKKPAPPPPLPKSRLSIESTEYLNGAQTSSPNSLEDSSCSGSERSSNNQEHYRLHKSTHGKWKRKKGPAPQCPIPQRRRIKPMPMKDIKQELLDIEIKQQELERQGVKLEKDIRLKCNEDLNNVDVEEMVLQLFELVNEKNELFRKHAELMYLRRQHNLEEEHAELEYQIRVLMSQPDTTKTDTEKEREEELIQRLVEVVGRRNEIVENLEKDRLREVEEDRSVFNQIGTFAQDEMLPCVKPVEVTVVEGKKNFSKRLLKNIKKVKSKKEKPDESSPSRSPSNSSHNKGTLKKFMTLGNSSKKFLRPKSS